jgi:hypothetical protein
VQLRHPKGRGLRNARQVCFDLGDVGGPRRVKRRDLGEQLRRLAAQESPVLATCCHVTRQVEGQARPTHFARELKVTSQVPGGVTGKIDSPKLSGAGTPAGRLKRFNRSMSPWMSSRLS